MIWYFVHGGLLIASLIFLVLVYVKVMGARQRVIDTYEAMEKAGTTDKAEQRAVLSPMFARTTQCLAGCWFMGAGAVFSIVGMISNAGLVYVSPPKTLAFVVIAMLMTGGYWAMEPRNTEEKHA